MNLRSLGVKVGSGGIIFASVLCFMLRTGHAAPLPQADQNPSAQKPVMSEQYFKNVQILRGIPVDEFMGTMGFIAAATGMNCTDCHVDDSGGNWAKYADDTPLKQTARRMILMVNQINKTNFAGKPEVTCYSCHQGGRRPK